MNKLTRILRNGESGLRLYSLTPPGADISTDDLEKINRRRLERISRVPFDGLSIYDVQQENFRNKERRTYEYKEAMNPLNYSRTLSDSNDLPRLIYLVAGKYSEQQLCEIFQEHMDRPFVLVGSPDSQTIGKTSLERAFQLASESDSLSGAVLIGERHRDGKSEVNRVFRKIERGADFFISQCIYNVSAYENFLHDYADESAARGIAMKPVILTFAPVGTKKGVDFMRWLGVDIPGDFDCMAQISEEFLPFTLSYLKEAADYLIGICEERRIPFGLNFESVISRGKEINASLDLAEKFVREPALVSL